jgi:hypothetical protein
VTRLSAALCLLLIPVRGLAQELEPGAYWPIPKGLNVATAVVSVNRGDVTFDPSLPVDEASATVSTTAFAFTRGFGVNGRSANATVVWPIIAGHLDGVYLGERTNVDRFGLGDPRLKIAMNLVGAPAMSPTRFASYRQGLIVGMSLTVAPPIGQYDSTRIVNLGSNRWSFKPELGLSLARGKWIVELMAGVWLFTDNPNFVGGRTREQDPILSTQVHVTRRFKPGVWLAADGNFFKGGRTTIGGKQNLDLQRNSRIGGTLSKALDRHQAIRISVNRGAYTTIGADFTSIAVGYNYAWVR